MNATIVSGDPVNVTSYNKTIYFVDAIVLEPSAFISIPHCCYWTIVTMT